MSAPIIPTTQTLILPFLYLSSGYLSLLLGFFGAQRLDVFFHRIGGTDKILLTFIIGSFSVITVFLLYGKPPRLGLQYISTVLFPLLFVTAINSGIIWGILMLNDWFEPVNER